MQPQRTPSIACSKVALSAQATPDRMRMGNLQEGVVGTVEHILGFAESVDLVGARLLACVVVLEEPIAICMERHDVLTVRLQLQVCFLLRVDVCLEGIVGLRFGGLLVLKKLGACGARLLRVFHCFFVIFLRV